jgi:hypothetical protein
MDNTTNALSLMVIGFFGFCYQSFAYTFMYPGIGIAIGTFVG